MVHHFIFMTTPVEIYTKFGCPYCVRAKHLLDTKGVPLDTVLAELDRREGVSGIAEKAARSK